MKKILVIPFFFIVSLSFSQVKNKVNADCIIKPDIGINDLKLTFTSIDSIYNIFGKTELVKKDYGKDDGGVQYILTYTDKGIVVRLKKEKKSYIIISIVAQSPCLCKTMDGVGVGSTKEELILKMGKPLNSWENETDSHLDYKGILFLLKNKGQNKFVIKEIMIVPIE